MRMPKWSPPATPIPMPTIGSEDCGDRMEATIITMDDGGEVFFRLRKDGVMECESENYEKALVQICDIFLRAVNE